MSEANLTLILSNIILSIIYRNKELSTTDDNYVRWTQWIFLQLFKNGLAFQSDVSVNWCPALGNGFIHPLPSSSLPLSIVL